MAIEFPDIKVAKISCGRCTWLCWIFVWLFAGIREGNKTPEDPLPKQNTTFARLSFLSRDTQLITPPINKFDVLLHVLPCVIIHDHFLHLLFGHVHFQTPLWTLVWRMMVVLFIRLHDDDDDDDVPRPSPLQQPDENFRNSKIGSGQT